MNQTNIKVVYENDYLLIVDKPIKMLSHPDQHSKDLPDVLSMLRHPQYRVITRLDVNTSGLVLIAKTSLASSILNEMSAKKQIRKFYQAVAIGYFSKEEDTIEAYLLKDSLQGVVRLSEFPAPNSQKIVTHYKVIKEENQLSLLEVELITGKTHQIRAHLAFISHPVLGDPLYGSKRINDAWKQHTQCLSSSRILFENIDSTSPLFFMNNQEIHRSEHQYLPFFQKK